MITGYLGSSVFSTLTQDAFLAKWDKLYEECNWVTAFQSRSYVQCWYNLYQNTYTPLLIVQKTNEEITGIFPLAISPENIIVGAGHYQAEYQSWLCEEKEHVSFFTNAVKWIRKEFPTIEIHLRYLPHQVQFDALFGEKYLRGISYWKAPNQPVIKVEEEFLSNELKKKNRKEKINRLKRIGVLTFEKVESIDDFKIFLDELIVQYDFRQGALFGEEFFALDKMKKELMLQVFERGLLHVSYLKLNDEIIASNAGIQGKGVVYLQGFNTHSPFYAKYSPGILLFLMLGVQMSKEGFAEFDLTPGGTEGYKGDLATNLYVAHELVITNRINKIKHGVISGIRNSIKNGIFNKNQVGFRIDGWVKGINDFLKMSQFYIRVGPTNFHLKRNLLKEPHHGVVVSRITDSEESIEHKLFPKIGKDTLSDLLLFSESDGIITRQEFLFDAMKRLEFGHCAYTIVAGGKLLACLWYIPKDAKIDHPVNTKSESPYIFLAVYSEEEGKNLKGSVTEAILDIFQKEKEIETLIFKINKGYKNSEELIDSGKLGFNSSVI